MAHPVVIRDVGPEGPDIGEPVGRAPAQPCQVVLSGRRGPGYRSLRSSRLPCWRSWRLRRRGVDTSRSSGMASSRCTGMRPLTGSRLTPRPPTAGWNCLPTSPCSPLWLQAHAAGPGVVPQYRNPSFQSAARLNALASATFNQGTAARDTAERYLRDTVLFASVLFLVAIAQRFKVRSVRIATTTVALGLAAYTSITVAPVLRHGLGSCLALETCAGFKPSQSQAPRRADRRRYLYIAAFDHQGRRHSGIPGPSAATARSGLRPAEPGRARSPRTYSPHAQGTIRSWREVTVRSENQKQSAERTVASPAREPDGCLFRWEGRRRTAVRSQTQPQAPCTSFLNLGGGLCFAVFTASFARFSGLSRSMEREGPADHDRLSRRCHQ